MAYADRIPVGIIANGTRSGLLPSPPSTVSSVTTPKQRPISPPGTPLQSPKSSRRNKHQHQRARPLPQSTVLSPRPLQDLLVERSYLVDSLAAQGARASELIRRLAAAEQAAAAAPDAGRRRLRKQVSLLRSKIAAAAGQEKAVIVRLGELYVEMQSRERWARARARAESSEQGYFPVMPPGGPAPGACLGAWEPSVVPMSNATGLSPESPEFVPGWAREGNPWPMPDVPIPLEQ